MQAVVGRAGLNPNRRITQVRGTSVTLNVGTAIQNRAAIANTSVVTGTVTDSGQPTPIATTSTLYTDPTTATFVAESDSTSTLIYSVSAFPVSVKAGDAG